MSDEQFRHYIETLQRQIAALKNEDTEAWEESAGALEGLQLIHEEMQTCLEAAEVVEEQLLQQNQQFSANYYHYYDLFDASPIIAYLVTNASGIILEGNRAIAQLLNVPQRYLAGKPLIVFVAESDRLAFHTKLNQLSQMGEVEPWELTLCPREEKPLLVQLHVAIARNYSGAIEALRIGVYDLSQSQKAVTQLTQQANLEESSKFKETLRASYQSSKEIKTQNSFVPTLPQSLDGLRVLIVDDEADAREFLTAVLESHGVGVTAVANAATALEVLEKFHPDVLVSDIRMPDEDGYDLIRRVRQLEAQNGWHIRVAAITAYLEEDREKALSAGFEAHLHKLAQPDELIRMVAQLAGRTSK